MSSAKKYIDSKTSGLNTLISDEDKIKHLITRYETAEIDADELSNILALLMRDCAKSNGGNTK